MRSSAVLNVVFDDPTFSSSFLRFCFILLVKNRSRRLGNSIASDTRSSIACNRVDEMAYLSSFIHFEDNGQSGKTLTTHNTPVFHIVSAFYCPSKVCSLQKRRAALSRWYLDRVLSALPIRLVCFPKLAHPEITPKTQSFLHQLDLTLSRLLTRYTAQPRLDRRARSADKQLDMLPAEAEEGFDTV